MSTVAASERTLPHSLDAERGCLGAVLIHAQVIETVQTLLPTHFYRDAHRRIWAAMTHLYQGRVAVDYLTLKEELGRRGELDEVGGSAYIASLVDGVPRSTNVQYYAGIVVEKAMLRDLIYAANKMLTSAYEGEQDAHVIMDEADRALLTLRDGGGAIGLRTLTETRYDRFQQLEWRTAHKGELRGVPTGFQQIDDLICGLRPGNLDIIAAATSIGKTTLALNMSVNAARLLRVRQSERHRVCVFSFEMGREELEDRILAQLSGVAATRIQTGHIGEGEWSRVSEALEEMAGLAISIDDRAGQTAEDVRRGCRRHMAEHGGVDVVIVDYVQLMASSIPRKGSSRTEQLGDTAKRLKELAKELAVPVVLLSQLRRHEGRPKIDDLRESGDLEQIADIVALLYRKDHRVSGTTEFILAKQRNGPTGTLNLTLDRDTTTFRDGGDPLPEPTAEERAETVRKRRQRTFAQRWGG